MPISDLRREASNVVKQLNDGDGPVYITQHGRPTAVLVDYKKYEDLLAELEALKAAQPKITYPTSEEVGTFSLLSEMAEDLGVDDLAENHDHYLYGTDKEA